MEQRRVDGSSETMLESLKQRARMLKGEIHALYLVARDRRTPWYAKVIVVLVVAYALSPIDLIPDFIPLLGYLDDLLLLPLGIYLALQLIPTDVLDDARRRAADSPAALPKRWFAAWLVIILWLVALAAAAIVIASLLDDMEIQTWIGA